MSSNWIDEIWGIPQLAMNAESEEYQACHQCLIEKNPTICHNALILVNVRGVDLID